MIRSFADEATRDLFLGINTKQARRACPREIWPKVQRRLERLDHAASLEEVQRTPGYRLEVLSGNRDGQFSIRINDQYRICFYWREGDAFRVEVTDYH